IIGISCRLYVVSLWTPRVDCGALRRSPLRLLPNDNRPHRLVRHRLHNRTGNLFSAEWLCGVHVGGWIESICDGKVKERKGQEQAYLVPATAYCSWPLVFSRPRS